MNSILFLQYFFLLKLKKKKKRPTPTTVFNTVSITLATRVDVSSADFIKTHFLLGKKKSLLWIPLHVFARLTLPLEQIPLEQLHQQTTMSGPGCLNWRKSVFAQRHQTRTRSRYTQRRHHACWWAKERRDVPRKAERQASQHTAACLPFCHASCELTS